MNKLKIICKVYKYLFFLRGVGVHPKGTGNREQGTGNREQGLRD
jgi:hypothetical protein